MLNKTFKLMEAVVFGTIYSWCPQGAHAVQKDDFDPRAGMCTICINEAMAEMDCILTRRGLVASAEEHSFND